MKVHVSLCCLMAVVGFAAACQLMPSKTISISDISQVWYEKKLKGDPFSVFFKCYKNEITPVSGSTTNSKRSSIFKWWPHITFTDTAAVENTPTSLYFVKRSFFGTSRESASILSTDNGLLILQTCSTGFFFKEKIHVYSSNGGDLSAAQTATITEVVNKAGWNLNDFKDISQTGC